MKRHILHFNPSPGIVDAYLPRLSLYKYNHEHIDAYSSTSLECWSPE